MARVGWGLLTDKIGFQFALLLATSSATALLITMPLTFYMGKIAYLLWVRLGNNFCNDHFLVNINIYFNGSDKCAICNSDSQMLRHKTQDGQLRISNSFDGILLITHI
jgi:hypothetical protein